MNDLWTLAEVACPNGAQGITDAMIQRASGTDPNDPDPTWIITASVNGIACNVLLGSRLGVPRPEWINQSIITSLVSQAQERIDHPELYA